MVVTYPCTPRVNPDLRVGLPASRKELRWMRVSCSTLSSPSQNHQIHEEEGRIMCEACKGTGWLICDFCEGQKTNVQTKNNRIYRRCPTCKAVGCLLCTKCKVYKCVTFPDFFDEA